MAVVRLRRRKWAERDGKWPQVGLGAAERGSDIRPEKPTFCEFPTADQEPKKNVPTGRLGGGSDTRRKHSFRWGALNHHAGAQPHDQGVCKQGRGPGRNQDGDERPSSPVKGRSPGERSAAGWSWPFLPLDDEGAFADDCLSLGIRRWLRGHAPPIPNSDGVHPAIPTGVLGRRAEVPCVGLDRQVVTPKLPSAEACLPCRASANSTNK